MEKVIVSDNQGNYFFWDDPEWGVDVAREDAVMVLDSETAAGYHYCHRSQLEYGPAAVKADGLQWELMLPDGKYIVTYYQYAPDSGGDLLQLVDYMITDKELICNAITGKYVEGATYFLIEPDEEVTE